MGIKAIWEAETEGLELLDLTIGDLLAGPARVDMPPAEKTFRQAGRVKQDGVEQKGLFD